MKSDIRKSKASGSTRRRVEWMVDVLHWTPDNRDVLPRRGHHLNVAWSAELATFNAPLEVRRNDSQ